MELPSILHIKVSLFKGMDEKLYKNSIIKGENYKFENGKHLGVLREVSSSSMLQDSGYISPY